MVKHMVTCPSRDKYYIISLDHWPISILFW